MGNKTEQRKRELLARAEEEFRRWDRPIIWEMDLTTAMALVGALQLALRHPGFLQRPSSKQVREQVLNFKDSIPPEWPAIRELIELGFHQRFDTE